MKNINFSFHMESHLLSVTKDFNLIHCFMRTRKRFSSSAFCVHLDNFSFIFVLYYPRDKEKEWKVSPRRNFWDLVVNILTHVSVFSNSPPRKTFEYAKETITNDKSYVTGNALAFGESLLRLRKAMANFLPFYTQQHEMENWNVLQLFSKHPTNTKIPSQHFLMFRL